MADDSILGGFVPSQRSQALKLKTGAQSSFSDSSKASFGLCSDEDSDEDQPETTSVSLFPRT